MDQKNFICRKFALEGKLLVAVTDCGNQNKHPHGFRKLSKTKL